MKVFFLIFETLHTEGTMVYLDKITEYKDGYEL